MNRMNEPSVTYSQSLQACKDGISGDTALLTRINAADTELHAHAEGYRTLATSGSLYTLTQVLTDINTKVVVDLTKGDLVQMYEYYFRDRRSGRHLYDDLMTAANEKCPFCGGIGRPRTLDHFMPKAKFPQFSVLPLNLIPSCRDCNMDGKGQSSSQTAKDQILHPYLDAPHFFEEQWIFAQYTPDGRGEPGVIEYFVDPPENWSDVDKQRVERHFSDFDLERRYSREASAALTEVEAQLKGFLRFGDVASFKQTILQPVVDTAPFMNHWKRVMYLGIMEEI